MKVGRVSIHEVAAKRRAPLVLILLVAACALGALAAPAFAAAQTFTVDSTGDQVDETVGTEGCETAVGTCTLRAALEEANASSGAVIAFDSSVFAGTAAGTITLGSELPTISKPVTIEGGTCTTEGGAAGPCVGVTGGGTGLTVHSADVTVEGIAFLPTSTYTGSALAVSGSPRFKATDVWFGIALNGSERAYMAGAVINSNGITASSESAELDGDRISAYFIGLELLGPGAVVRQSSIYGGFIGIFTYQSNDSIGNVIEGGSVRGNVEAGIALDNDGNEVLGEKVKNELGYGAIVVGNNSTDNVIGGDLASEENVITTEHTNGITIEGPETTENEIGRNRGSAAGEFIALKGTPGSGPNGNIQPPPAATGFESSARGTGAEPGAKIRLFAKATETPGEIASYLGMATADSSGAWRVIYAAKVTAGTFVTATQTNVLGGTSELSELATATTDPACPSADAVECEKPPAPPSNETTTKTTPITGSPTPTPVPATAPQTKIAKGPKARSTATTAKFKFTASVPGSTFQCKLDAKKFTKCASPKAYKHPKPGKHTFQVRAVGPTGLVDATPAKRTFTVLDQKEQQ